MMEVNVTACGRKTQNFLVQTQSFNFQHPNVDQDLSFTALKGLESERREAEKEREKIREKGGGVMKSALTLICRKQSYKISVFFNRLSIRMYCTCSLRLVKSHFYIICIEPEADIFNTTQI